MKTKTIIITLIFIISAGIQLLTQIIVTRLFGAGIELTNFLVAVTIPTMLVTVVYATLNDAFLPQYGDKLVNKSGNHNYFSSVFYSLLSISLVAAIILSLFSVPIVQLLFRESSNFQIVEVSRQLSFMIFCLPLAVAATLLGSWWYAHKHFIRFPLAQLLGTVSNILLIILLYKILGIWALVIAFVLNLLFQIFYVFIKIKPSFSWSNTIQILSVWSPLIVGAIAMRSDTLLIRAFGLHLEPGSLVYLNLLSKIYSVSTGLFTVGIQVLLLPHLVDYFSQKKYHQADRLITKAKFTSILVSVGVSLSVYLLSPTVIKFLFVGGKFTLEDVHKTVALLPIFVLPGVGWGLSSVFFQPLLAMKKQLEVGIISVTSLIFAWLSASYSLTHGLGVWSIGIGLSVLLFGGIVGSETVWQHHRRKLFSSALL